MPDGGAATFFDGSSMSTALRESATSLKWVDGSRVEFDDTWSTPLPAIVRNLPVCTFWIATTVPSA